MEDSKVAELRQIHRDLAAYLKEQQEAVDNSIIAVAAIRGALESRPDLQKAYWASHRALTEDGTFRPSSTYENTLQRLLKKLADW